MFVWVFRRKKDPTNSTESEKFSFCYGGKKFDRLSISHLICLLWRKSSVSEMPRKGTRFRFREEEEVEKNHDIHLGFVFWENPSARNLVSEELDLVPDLAFICWVSSWYFLVTELVPGVIFSPLVSSWRKKVVFLYFNEVKSLKKLPKGPNFGLNFIIWATFGQHFYKWPKNKQKYSLWVHFGTKFIFSPGSFTCLVILVP